MLEFVLVATLCLQLHLTLGPVVATSSRSLPERFANATKFYDKRVRPFYEVKRLNVSIQLAVTGLGPLDETHLTLGIDYYLRVWWEDDRLNFGEGLFTFIGDPYEVIWVPDVFITNSVENDQHSTLTPNIRTQVGPHGKLFVSSRNSARTFCKMDLKRYPFDHQECTVELESYSYNGSEVSLSWKNSAKPVEYINSMVQLSGYELIHISGSTKRFHYSNGEMFTKLVVKINVKRTFIYHLFSGYMPSSLLVILTWATFWIPSNAVPARVTLIVTNFLSTVFVIQQELSKIVRVDYVTAMEIFLITNLLFVVLTMVEFLIVLNYPQCRKGKDLDINGISNNVALRELEEGNRNENGVESDIAKNGKQQREERGEFKIKKTHVVDRYSRILFPVAYTAIAAIYTGYYSSSPRN